MSRTVKKGSLNVSVEIRIIDSTDGTPELGVLYNTSGIDLRYRRELSALVSITEVTLASLTTAHADGGFLEIGNGYYRLDLPDAACASGANRVLVTGTVTGMVVIGELIELVDYDPQDGVRLGLTALPNAVANAANGLPISIAGALDLDALNTAAVRLTAARATIIDDWADAGRLDAILDEILVDSATTIQSLITTLDTVADSIKVDTAAILADTGTDGVVLSSATRDGIANSLLDLVDAIESGWPLRETIRILLSAAGGKSSGHSTNTPKYRDPGDTKDRISATTTSDGRTSVTLDGS